jgi:hypothetical protein
MKAKVVKIFKKQIWDNFFHLDKAHVIVKLENGVKLSLWIPDPASYTLLPQNAIEEAVEKYLHPKPKTKPIKVDKRVWLLNKEYNIE